MRRKHFLAATAAVLLFAGVAISGCDVSGAASVSVATADDLQDALTNGDVEDIRIEASFTSNVSAIVTVPKTIIIPKNYRVAIEALQADAAVTLTSSGGKAAVSQREVGVFQIKRALIVNGGGGLDIKGGANLALNSGVTAKIDGSLRADADSVYCTGGSLTVTGSGSVNIGGKTEKTVPTGTISGDPTGGLPTSTAKAPQTVSGGGSSSGGGGSSGGSTTPSTPSNPSTPTTPTTPSTNGGLTVNIGFVEYGEIPITGENNGITIYQLPTGTAPSDTTPIKVTLTVSDEWDDIAWFVDNSGPLTENPLILYAENFSPAKHTLIFTGRRKDIPYSKRLFFTVIDQTGTGNP